MTQYTERSKNDIPETASRSGSDATYTESKDDPFNETDVYQYQNKSSYVDVIDVCYLSNGPNSRAPNGGRRAHRRLANVIEMCSYLKNSGNRRDCDTRIISICQTYSWASLDISQDTLQTILSHYNVSREFTPVLKSFYPKTMELEEGFITSPWRRINQTFPNGRLAYEMGYIFKYPEIKSVDQTTGFETWSIRQTGVYQRVVGDVDEDKGNILILLHPRYSSPLQKELEAALVYGDSASMLHNADGEGSMITKKNTSPLELHLFILGTYLYNWRAYMKKEEELLIKTSYEALCIDITEDLPFNELYEYLSGLHNLERRLAPLKSIFSATRRILQLLTKLNDTYTHPDRVNIKERLENLEEMVNGFDDNLQYLISRLGSISSLLSNTISLKNENTSNQVSNSMLKYNRFTVDDSATVRVITLVTLIYLPPTSVSGFFSMGALFSVQNDGISQKANTLITPYIWLYFVVVIPLTAVTVAYWWWKSRRQRLERGKHETSLA
ncbi:conserved hypothetical protein [Talaromyces stipitatus ATCC 10500]|uniref:CorA-like transporter domain-containing protein n=1 Tax=Talaromyces stipitatus (strain ATCC 10500 / CBS 375.48 / QM 6759 / NRRL 1006) TaxID=441959 RepID=B8ME11_TALSN|nr:uncharacterized protein TSTA_011970 [Talaromyces stipitatus ATCC 10500]EED16088.1 conserved hypothetical protein [Talaromyces stipitatus ATCC 10500]